jgi:hypothetical protein
MYLFEGFIVKYVISGSAFVPARVPALSPKDLVMAKPGVLISFIHTRNGPTYSFFSFICG